MLENYLPKDKGLKHGRRKAYNNRIHIQRGTEENTHCGLNIWSNQVMAEEEVKEWFVGLCRNCFLAWEKRCKKSKKGIDSAGGL